MKKKKSYAFGRNTYLLGKGTDGEYYWLEESTWDCGWYWSIGYVETYMNKLYPSSTKDISSHQLWRGLFPTYDTFVNFFEDAAFDKKESYLLYELMESLYTARNYSDMLHRGGSHITTNPCNELIKCEEEYGRINKVLIPQLLSEVYKILTPEVSKTK